MCKNEKKKVEILLLYAQQLLKNKNDPHKINHSLFLIKVSFHICINHTKTRKKIPNKRNLLERIIIINEELQPSSINHC